MINVVLLGTGNVATHLFRAFAATENVRVRQVYNHSETSLSFFSNKTAVTTSLDDLFEADIYLIALKDDVIAETAQQLSGRKGIVAHTSGGSSIEVLDSCDRRGVFYPLQTFSKQKTLDYSQIPFCIEAGTGEDLELLRAMAGPISGKAYEINSPQRKRLHLAAVFVCNFVNHLYAVGETICQEGDMPFEILQPLIQETAHKIISDSPRDVQTGPAIRNDKSTIKAHLDLLQDPENKEIYHLLTKAIQTFHGKKL